MNCAYGFKFAGAQPFAAVGAPPQWRDCRKTARDCGAAGGGKDAAATHRRSSGRRFPE